MVNNPLTLTLDDLKENYPSRNQYVTLSCISGRIGTSLISTTYWTGVSLLDILEDLEVSQDAAYLYITSADGYYETLSLDLVRSDPRIMLCYSWDGSPLDPGSLRNEAAKMDHKDRSHRSIQGRLLGGAQLG
jgi:DMSO/TMAO reductase YedYZ molybdopterin-dependent catalytic subunit